MKWAFASASRAALIFGLLGVSTTAFAQQAPSPEAVATARPGQASPQREADVDEIVVLGSLIATTREDAAKPVDVFSVQDLREQGSPTVTDFLRSIPSAAPSADNMAGATAGATVAAQGRVSLNLRGQGTDGTLILLNGRRISATSGGDLNTIPMDALRGVEVLKEGASATYGAGAVGGVVNFRTRRDVDGLELTLGRTLYKGSEGAYKANVLAGRVGGAGNVLVSATYEKEASMLVVKRDYGNLPFEVNPGGWAMSNTTARFHRYANWSTAQPTNLTVGSGGGTVSANFNDFTSDRDCATIGGALVQDLQPGGGAATPTLCAFRAAPWTDMVQGFTRYQVYAEANADISDTMELHVDAGYNWYDTVGRRPPGASPIAARAMDPSVATACGTTSCYYLIPYEQLVYTPGGQASSTLVRNPFIADFNARQPGTANDVGPGMALMTSSIYRPYLFGGNAQYDYGPAKTHSRREQLQVAVGLKGKFTEDSLIGSFLNGISYDYSAQFTRYVVKYIDNGDWLANRLQDALMGYGGPNCQAIDRVPTDYSSAAAFNRTIGIQSDTAPGTNGCMWFNPFQSNFKVSSANGAVNPNFPTAGSPTWGVGATQAGNTGPDGYINDPALVDWMWSDRSTSLTNSSLILDAVFTGTVPDSWFKLPGGSVAWAVGSQWRLYERSGALTSSDAQERQLQSQPCPYSHTGQTPQAPIPSTVRPTSRGCPGLDGTGNFYSLSRRLYPTELVTESTEFDFPVAALFGELDLPVTDTLTLIGSVRHESFNGGDLKGTIWSAAAKWEVTPNLFVRASYGTNFRATDALYLTPGASQLILNFDNTRFGTGYSYPVLTTVDDGIKPESDVTYNVGVGYRGALFEGRIEAGVDFWGIEIKDEVVSSVATTVLDNVFKAGAVGAGSTAHQADCSARLISFVQFSTGACQQGVSTAGNVVQVERITRNGPTLNTNGIDYFFAYRQPLLGGDISFTASATQNIKFRAGPFEVNGVVFDEGGDRLGYRNSTRTGSPSQKWRGNATIRWGNEVHSVGLRANYYDGFKNDPAQTRTPTFNAPGTVNDQFSEYGWHKQSYLDFDLNYIYTARFWENFTVRASVLNLADKSPPEFQTFVGYDTLVGNPRGRTLKVEVAKRF